MILFIINDLINIILVKKKIEKEKIEFYGYGFEKCSRNLRSGVNFTK